MHTTYVNCTHTHPPVDAFRWGTNSPNSPVLTLFSVLSSSHVYSAYWTLRALKFFIPVLGQCLFLFLCETKKKFHLFSLISLSARGFKTTTSSDSWKDARAWERCKQPMTLPT